MGVTKRVAAGGFLSLFVMALVAIFVVSGGNAAGAAVNQGQVVPDSPRRNVPVVLDGRVLAHAQIGDRIFVGGEFQQVQRPDGSVITQPHIFAYDIDTGLLDENFRPVLNNAVFDLQTNPAGNAVYASGKFWKWDGSFPNRIAKLSADGTLDTSFQGSADALVRSIAVTNTGVYMAGNFTSVSGQPRTGFAAVDSNSGAIDNGFVMNVNNSVVTGQYGRGIVATSDGNTVFGLHFGTAINGVQREAVAKINVAGPTATLANWSVPWLAQAGVNCLYAVRDIAISPDNSYIVVGGQGADRPPNCDSVLRYETGGTGTINYTWSARMYSSVFSLAVSDVAVYVGGHFCAAPKNGAPPGGITHVPNGATANQCEVNNPASPLNPSVIFPNDAVFRGQMAALNPSNGQALAWDPGSNNSVAVYDMTLINRGLLAGHDSNRFSSFLVGRSGFFDFGAPADTTAPTVTVGSPQNGAILSTVSTLQGTATDDRNVTEVTVRLKNITTGQWLQANGSSFAASQANAPVTLTPTGLGTVDWAVNLGVALPAGDYEIRAFAKDQAGQTTSPTLVSSFRIAGAASCTVSLDANDNPVISWSEFANVGSVSVRRDGKWKATGTPDSGTYTDTTTTAGSSYSYAVRWKPLGTNVDVACNPTSITIPNAPPPPPANQTCSAVRNANDSITLTWTAIAGEDSYTVRRNGSYLTNVGNSLTFTQSPGFGTWDYLIRSKKGGVTTNTSCGAPITIGVAPPAGPQTCSATANANGSITLTWTPIAGEDNYTVRRNGKYLTNVGNSLTFTQSPGNGTWDYLIRSKKGGVTTNTSCGAPITIGNPPPAGGQTCSATTNGNGSVTLTWTAIAGENSYGVRRNGGWIASTGNLSYTDNGADAGDTYVIRSRQGGVTTNTTCN